MSPLVKGALGFFVAGVLAGLVQLWFEPWGPAAFLRVEATLGALLLVLVVFHHVGKEARDFERQKDRLD